MRCEVMCVEADANESIFFVCKGVARRFHFYPHGCSGQVKLLAETTFQKTLVRIGHVLKGVAMHHDDGRIHTTLMGISQLGTEHA